MLDLFKRKGKEIYFIKRNEINWWNKCKINEQNCILFKKRKTNFQIINFDKINKKTKKIDLVGVYQYLDHVKNPSSFIKKLFKISKSQAYIVDNFEEQDKRVYIQHFTGWNKSSFSWAAKKFNKKLNFNFYNKNFLENKLFILS